MAWDSSFKNLLKRYLTGATVITEMEVPQANLRLDFLVRHDNVLQYPFNNTKEHLAGEFKSVRDRFNVHELHKSIAKAYLYSSNEKVDIEKITLVFVLSKSIPKRIEELYTISEIQKGIYRVVHNLDIQLILLNKIDYDESNSYLGIFARRAVRWRAIKRALIERERFIISVAYFLYKEEVIEVAHAENIDVDPISLSIRSAVESIGITRVVDEVGLDRVLEEVGLDRVIKEIGLDKVIKEISLDKVIKEIGLENLVDKLSEENRERLLKVLSEKMRRN